MSKTKGLLGIAVAIALATAQISVAAAAPVAAPIVGDITGVTVDGTAQTVTVEYTSDGGVTTDSVVLTFAEAQTLGLIDINGSVVGDPTGTQITVDGNVVTYNGSSVTLTGEAVDPCAPAPDAGGTTGGTTTLSTTTSEESSGGGGQPVAEALCGYFNGSLGVTLDQIMTWHEDGFGFGVIAQALFMAELGGLDPQAILDAKNGTADWSTLGLEGVDNWGRLRQALLGKAVDKSMHNLGAIMSGRVTPVVTETPTASATQAAGTTTLLKTQGKGKGGQHGNKGGNGHGNGH